LDFFPCFVILRDFNKKAMILNMIYLFLHLSSSLLPQDYTRIEGTQIEFLCPSGFSFYEVCYGNGELRAGICFNIMDDKSELSTLERAKIFEKEKVVRRIPIHTTLDCTDLFLLKQQYMPGDITYEYFASLVGKEKTILITCSTANQIDNLELEKRIVDALSSMRFVAD
jgi:hypothetical protein